VYHSRPTSIQAMTETFGQAEKGQSSSYTDVDHLRRPKHRAKKSRLPGPLWLLTFAPAYPSIFRDFKGNLSHPYTLYVVGTITALISGVGIPAFDIIYVNILGVAGQPTRYIPQKLTRHCTAFKRESSRQESQIQGHQALDLFLPASSRDSG